MRHLLLLGLAILLAGCKPSHPPPEGFVESCYGGDFAKYHDGNTPRISIRIAMTESDWPGLAETLRQFGVRHNLDFFDTTLKLDHVHALGPRGGISTRQHNGPAGDQDVWHFHLHVLPRVRNDGLYGGARAPYGIEERLEVAQRLRTALGRPGLSALDPHP